MDFNWFQIGPISDNQILGTYNYGLVVLSYVIAVLASYVALDLAARVRAETNAHLQVYWLLGGAFAMGAGIWSMHFIGMLAFFMPMGMGYDYIWTIASLLAAILASALALYILKNKERPIFYMLIGGIFIGLGIATMHYMGMTGMTNHVNIRYLPSLFFLSIVIAIFASEAALWFALQSSQGSFKRQFNLKIISAFIMGIAICGMHYTGMAAAVFTPLLHPNPMSAEIMNPYLLAFMIAGITTLIIAVALAASLYSRHMATVIQNEKEFLKVMLNNLDDGILACDHLGKITVCNNALNQLCVLPKNIFCHDLNEYFKLSLSKTHSNSTAFENPLLNAFEGEHIRDQEYLLRLQDGEERNVIIDGQPIINLNKEKIGAVIVIHDVTSLKQTEKLKKEFVSIVSHELRTPLTSISGSLSLLLGGAVGELSEKIRDLLQIANNNTERLIRLINDILDIEKIEAGKMDFNFKHVNIADVINNAITDVKTIADKAEVHFVFDELTDATLNADPDRLMQVLVNLFSNAIHFSSPGQTIKVKITIFDTTVRVSVIDQGTGIPESFSQNIFQKFSQANGTAARRKSGTGLGLSISKAIIEKHGGNINFESSTKGTCFYFDLPKIAESKKEMPLILSKTNSNILICDSNPDAASMLKEFFIQNHFSADIALTAAEARKLLSKNKYEMIALDLILQDYDGVKFIHELRSSAETSAIPIIITSTRVSEGKQILNGSAFPIVDWIQKPVSKAALAKLLEYIRRHKTQNLPQILCVEDDPDISKIITELLKSEARTFSAVTLESARNKLLNEPFDLIVLDLRLPDGMGTDLLPCINCQTKEIIPVVVFSAYELERKYAHLVRKSLLKSQVTNEKLFAVLTSILKNNI